MKTLFTILTLTLSVSLLSYGGSTDDKKTEPPPEAAETETPHTSRATVGDAPGKFTLGDSDITILVREPRDGEQVVTFIYLQPCFSDVRTYDILKDLDPRLSGAGGKPTPYGTWNDVKEVGYHDIVGGIFEVFYPDVSGDCTLNVSTAYGPVTVELGDAGKTFRYAAKVRPGMKAELRTWPSISYAFRELEPGDVVFPTGEAELVEFEGDDVEWLMFQKVTTPLGEDGWIIDDDEVFEYAGYLEAPAE